ncbi:hypothetical protein TNCV_1592371 [Trichonephila clavipes]|nr:hypothetical protein TNCV_1592371 [Trichonephila clavipes]
MASVSSLPPTSLDGQERVMIPSPVCGIDKEVHTPLLVMTTQIIAVPNEHAEVPQHDVAWIRLMSEVVLEVNDTMNPVGQSTNQ